MDVGPDKTDTIYVGKLKLMTGGDKMTTRGLYKNDANSKPQFKIILMCNDLPKLGGNDGGIWRRIEVVEYISKFTDERHDQVLQIHISTRRMNNCQRNLKCGIRCLLLNY